MGRLSQLTGRRREDGNSAGREDASSEQTAEFDRTAADLRTAIAALGSAVESLRMGDGDEASSAPEGGAVEPPESGAEPPRDDQVSDAPAGFGGAPPAADGADGAAGKAITPETEAITSENGALDSVSEETSAPDGSEPQATSSKSAADAGTAERQRGLLRRVGRRRKSPHESITRNCMVCGSTFTGTEEELRASGGRLAGDLYICARCQREGWVFPN